MIDHSHEYAPEMESDLSEPLSAREEDLADTASGSPLSFRLLILLTAIIFLRPAEMVPQLEGLPIYELVILACLAASFGKLLPQLRWRTLSTQPWALCVLGFLLAIVLAGLGHGNFYAARTDGAIFAKILIYYFLLTAVVDSPARLNRFLVAVAIFLTAIAGLAALNYHGYINIAALEPMKENTSDDPITGETQYILRLMATGVFHDPNDFALILVVAAFITLFGVFEQQATWLKILSLAAIGVQLYAFMLTLSRGGMVAFLAGGAAWVTAKLGWRRALIIGLPLLALVLVAVGGRQASINIDDDHDTGQARIQLWRHSLILFRGSPIIGIGVGKLEEENGLVAHNSYVHAFAELGVVGGIMFVGAWYLGIGGIVSAMRHQIQTCGQLKPADWSAYILAALVAYAAGIFSLTRCYTLPTYLVLALAAAYNNIYFAANPDPCLQLSWRVVWRTVGVGMGALIFLFVFVALFAH